MPIAYNYSGTHEDLSSLLRRFRLDELLRYISNYSAELMRRHRSDTPKEAAWEKYYVLNSSTRRIEEKETLVTGWGLIDLAFQAIISTNDYRGKVIESREEFFLLMDAIWATKEVDEMPVLDSFEDGSSDILFYMFGFMTEQFRFQDLSINNFAVSRELYILLDIASEIPGITKIEEIIIREVGTSWRAVVTSLFLVFSASLAGLSIDTVLGQTLWNESVSRQDFEKVLAYYSATYRDVRDSDLKRQYLYTKPFIYTDRTKEALCISPQLCLMLYEHCIFWIVRNHFLRDKDQRFTSEFGTLFEAYFCQLLEKTVGYGHFEKIIEDDREKRADWKISISKYSFLVEQKSAALGLMAKQQETDINAVKRFCLKNLVKAIQQLDVTEKYYNDKKYIKIILIYEDYLNTHILEQVFQMQNCNVVDDGFFWLITIDEAERLFTLYHDDLETFDSVIEKKIQREVAKSKDGRAVEQILRSFGIAQNSYLQKPEISKYNDFGKNNMLPLLPKDDLSR